MSLEATHLRFALEIKEDLGILDLERYCAGVVYPDSRYMTGINRHLTHNLAYFEGRKDLTDFEKGWIAHIIGDRIFKEVTEDKFPDLVLFDELRHRWPVVTAIKIIQDLKDFGSFDIQGIIGYLDYYELHFREDERKVIEYNSIIQGLYRDKDKLSVEDCLSMWEKFGMSRQEISTLRKKIIELYEDAKLIGKIQDNFSDGMDLYGARYRQIVGEYRS